MWQEEIVFTEWFPPLVQRMKIQLRDSSEQVIATSYLNLQSMVTQASEGLNIRKDYSSTVIGTKLFGLQIIYSRW